MDRQQRTDSPAFYDVNRSFALSPRDLTRPTSSASSTDKKPTLTDKLRQTLASATTKRSTTPQNKQTITPTLTHLTTQSQELILRTVDIIKQQDSENVIDTLDQSRNILKTSLEEFKREQDEYRQQLEEIIREKQANMRRPKENTIPLSVLLKQKHDNAGLADLRPNSSINLTYQAHFEALLVDAQNQQQHASDRAAVIKYIRRRERRKRAEENKKNHQLSDDTLEQKTAELLQNMEGIDVKLEHERQRQNDLLKQKMTEKKIKTHNLLQASEILDQAHEANLQRDRMEKMQREKIEARLSAARQQQNRSPSNMIHVQSHVNEEDEGEDGRKMNDEEREMTKQSIERLQGDIEDGTRSHLRHHRNDYDGSRGTPLYGDGKSKDERVSQIEV